MKGKRYVFLRAVCRGPDFIVSWIRFILRSGGPRGAGQADVELDQAQRIRRSALKICAADRRAVQCIEQREA